MNINTTEEIVKILCLHQQSSALYLYSPEQILDFTDREKSGSVTINIVSANGTSSISLGDEWSSRFFVKAAAETIMADGRKILTWDWKSLVSFLLGRYKIHFNPKCSIVDLKILESYGNTRPEMPNSVRDFMSRLREVTESPKWPKRQRIYRDVHLPLILSVIPEMESVGILSTEKLHAHYDVAGQENGRMLSRNVFSRGFVPHVITPEMRESLKPTDFDNLFTYFDYRSMEVQMLAWLSKDAALSDLCSSNDIYASAYEAITKTKCDTNEKRSLCKSFFLPIFYGMGAKALENKFGMSERVAKSVIERITGLFPIASKWLFDVQSTAESDGIYTDFIGRSKSFSEKHYKARNFAVQSPSAIFCMHGLVRLHEALNGKCQIAYNVHDGYMLYAKKENLREIVPLAASALTVESEFFLGLAIGVSCSIGRSLADMKVVSIPRKKNEEHLSVIPN